MEAAVLSVAMRADSDTQTDTGDSTMNRREWLERVKVHLSDTEITVNYEYLIAAHRQGESPQRAADYIINTSAYRADKQTQETAHRRVK